MIRREDLIKIGQFNKPHALAGELSFTFTDDVFDRSNCPYVVCDIDGILVPFFIEDYRFRSNTTALMKLEGVDSADNARMFTNLDVFYPKEYIQAEEAMQGGKEFFLGFAVSVEGYGYLGQVVSVEDSTANVLFEIETDDEGKETLLIPAVDDFVLEMDAEKKTILMRLPEGLLDF